MNGYVAILLSIVVLVLACVDKQNVQGGKEAASQTPVAVGTEADYAVTNYYPWMNLQMLSGIVKQGIASEFSVSYAC